MATLLQLCFLGLTVAGAISTYIIYNFNHKKNIHKIEKLIKTEYILLAISSLFNNVVHCIFAMKYWVLSRKIKQIINK